MKHRSAVKRLLNASLVSFLAAVSSHALASGFQLFEYNGIVAGDAGAGGAAIAEDASTSFINPAGLTRLKNQQVVIAGTAVLAKTQYEGSSRFTTASAGSTSTMTGTSKGNDTGIIPAFYYAAPINQRLVFGFGVSVPFGLSTKYADTAFTRYAATKSELSAIDISPSLAFKVNEHLSLGLGLDIEKMSATLDSWSGAPALGTAYDSASHNEGTDWGYGWHAGALYEFNPATRVGLSYRSQAVFHPSGTSTLTGLINPTGASSAALRTNITLPAMSTLSVYHDVTDRWALMGSVNYTEWSSVKTISLYNVQGSSGSVIPEVNLAQNFRNTWRFAVGTNYKIDPKWMVRAGVGYDQTPTNNTDRSIRLPDGNRTLVALGARYQATKMVGIDVGYTHLFMKDGPINATTVSGPSSVYNQGTSKNSADLIGLQVTWNLG